MKRRRDDFEATEHATRTRLGAHPIHFVPAPTTVAPHTHHAREIVSDPFVQTAADDVQEAIEELTTEKLARDGSQTMLGNLDFNTFKIYNLGALNFDTDTVVAAVDGGLQWADAEGIERLVMRADGVDMPVGGVYIKVKNDTGSPLAERTPVVVVAASGNLLTMEPADTSMALTDKVLVGLLMQDVADGESGWVCRLGYVGGLDFSAFTAGLQLYVDGTGTMSGAFPQVGCSARIRMGVVISPTSPGSMWVDPDWRPDLDELANVDTLPRRAYYAVPMWLKTDDGEPCDAWRSFPASRFPATQVVVDYSVDDEQVDVILLAYGTGERIISLPEIGAGGDTRNLNRLLRIKKMQAGGVVRIQSSGGQLIDGLYTEVVLKKKGEIMDLFGAQFGGDPFWEIL
jgi:hypothetical protein